MKYKMVYGKPQDDFIWKMLLAYSFLEKLYLKFAKWHLRKILKLDKEALDKLYQKGYNSLINEMLKNYTPYNNTVMNITAEQLIDKINEINESYWVSSDDVEKYYNNHMWDNCGLYPIDIDCNTVVKLERDSNESIN